MIPIQLTIQGLYSYQHKQTIDFSKLTQASIFGIFGNVGCGKSSILEAITFALYGKTDRLNLSGDNRNYNMMNLKSNELLIDFIFTAGNPQVKYRSVVTGKRNSKRFEDVKTLDRKGYMWQNENWVPTESEAIEKTLELSYENFKRTIIIPQGKFQEFLQLGNKDRTQMMKELFDLEKYELYYKVVSLENKNKTNLDVLVGKLQGLGEISLEEIEQLKEKSTVLKKEIDTLGIEIKKLTHTQKDFENLKILINKLELLNTKQKELSAKGKEIEQLEKQTKEYEYCKLNFESLLKDKLAFETELKLLEKSLSKASDKLKINLDKLEKSTISLAKLKPKVDSIEKLKKELSEIDHIIEIASHNKAIKELKQRIINGNTTVVETEKRLKSIKTQIETSDKQLNEIKTQKPDLIKLSAIKEWFTKTEALKKALKEQIQNSNDADFKQKKIETEIKSKLAEFQFLKIAENSNTNNLPAIIEKEIATINNQQKELDNKREQYLINSKLSEYADSLHDGEPCPLCGSEHHPNVYNAQDAGQKLSRLNQKKEKNTEAIELLTVLNKEISDLLSTKKYISETGKTYEKKHNELNKELLDHNKLNQWPEFKDINSVSTEIARAKTIEDQIAQLEKLQQQNREKLETEQKNYEKYKLTIDQFKNQITAKEASINTLESQVTQLNAAEFAQKELFELEQLKKEQFSTIQIIEKEFESLSKNIEHLKIENAALTQSVHSKKENRETLSKKFTETNNELTSKIDSSTYQNIERVSEILNYEINLDLDRKKIEKFKQEKSTNQQQVTELKSEIRDKKYNQTEHEAITIKINELSTVFRTKDQELGSFNNQVKEKVKLLETQKRLIKEKSQYENRAENLKVLKQLFKASGFVNYISTVHLQNICKAANERFFKLTGQKLSLEISDDNNFLVRDFMNSGKTRNVKTLSGGQTFQAALSLALSLADSIQNKTNSRENFFFLDEGFGSLDREALNVVFDTLKSLRKENRVVGVISHVEDMQHEIDTHLKIQFDEEKGSLISSSI